MTGGLMTSAARLTLIAAAGMLFAGSANAADLGGNCCADLEERIAELEATTVRKGNRKVSLTISGWVNEAVFFWDDGVESNVYVGTNNLERSRFKFSGEAKIDADWSAGYVIEVGVRGANSEAFSQTALGANLGLDVRKSAWFLKSKTYGKVSVGQDSTATYHLLDDADGVNTRNYSDAEAAAIALGAFRLRENGVLNSRTWRNVMGGFNGSTPGQNGRRNVVRYDSPTFAGFSASASWGEDDMWDAALTYKGEVGDFKLLGKLGYGESSDTNGVGGTGGCVRITTVATGDCQWWGAAGTVMHAPTGLFVYGGYGEQQIDLTAVAPANTDDTSTVWFVQAGIERKFIPLGKTTIFGEYRNDQAGVQGTYNAATDVSTLRSNSSDLDLYAAGVVQNIEAAAMDLYLIYRHAEGEAVFSGATHNLDDLDMVISGARIQF